MVTTTNNATNFANQTAKATPVGADLVQIADSAAGFAPKQATISSVIAAGGIVYNGFVCDFGSSPVYDGYFTITDAGVTTASNIVVTQSGVAASGQDADENELAAFMMNVNPGTGNFSFYLQCQDGLVAGKYTFYYSY